MSSREESSTMESVQKDIQCLRKVFSIVRLVKAAPPEGKCQVFLGNSFDCR